MKSLQAELEEISPFLCVFIGLFPLMIHYMIATWLHMFTPKGKFLEGRHHAFLSFILPTCLLEPGGHTILHRCTVYILAGQQ